MSSSQSTWEEERYETSCSMACGCTRCVYSQYGEHQGSLWSQSTLCSHSPLSWCILGHSMGQISLCPALCLLYPQLILQSEAVRRSALMLTALEWFAQIQVEKAGLQATIWTTNETLCLAQKSGRVTSYHMNCGGWRLLLIQWMYTVVLSEYI